MRDLFFVRPSIAAFSIAIFAAAVVFETFGKLVFLIRYTSMAILVPVGPEIAIIVGLPFAYNHVSCRYDTLRGLHVVPYRHASGMPFFHYRLHQIPDRNSNKWRISVEPAWELFAHE